jgi:hypothetical protein
VIWFDFCLNLGTINKNQYLGTMKRLRAWLVVCGVLLLSPQLFAQYTLTYSTNGSVITLTGYTGTPVNVAIPNFVTAIGEGAFQNCLSLTGVNIPNTVTTIGIAAFVECLNMTSLSIGDNVTSIGGEAFYFCSQLTDVSLPSSITDIGMGAFADCFDLTSVTIGENVTNVGIAAFASCNSLTNIVVSASNPIYSSVNGVLFDKNQTTLLEFPGGWSGSYAIPNNVTSIAASALVGASFLDNLTIPGSVTNIGYYAFESCVDLTNVTFLGNAPSADSTVFAGWDYPDPTTAYYMYGTTGWSAFSANTGIPAVLLNPPISGFGMQSNRFGFTVTGPTNTTVVIQACTNLDNPGWLALQTNTLANGSFYFSDPQWSNYPSRFYTVQFP